MTSLILIAALLSISVVPLIPKAEACKHASARLAGAAGCHTATPPSSRMRQMIEPEEDGMHNHQSDIHQHHGTETSPKMHQHTKKLTAAEKSCRIECGCGCHRSADSLPTLLPPHLTPLSPEAVTKEDSCRVIVSILPSLEAFDIQVPTPPPKLQES